MTYDGGCIKNKTVNTPDRRKAIISLTNENFQAAARHVVSFRKTKYHTMAAIVLQIQSEMKDICSKKHNSLLRIDRRNSQHSDEDAVKTFSWRMVWIELIRNVPTLVGFLRRLLPKSSKKFLCFIICAILKKRCMHMSLLQRVFSVVLCANATHKEVSIMDCMLTDDVI